MIPLAILCFVLVAVLVYREEQHHVEIKQTTEMFERILARQQETHDKALSEGRQERQELANRIQAPESTPVYDMPQGQPQSLPFGDDEAFWEYKAEQVNGDSD